MSSIAANSSVGNLRRNLNALVKALSALKCLFGKVFFLLATSGLALMASIGFEHKNVRSVEQERDKMNESLV